MKIIVSANSYWNIYNFRLSLIKQMIDEGHEIIAIGSSDDYMIKLKERGIQYREIKINSHSVNPISNISLLLQYYRAFKELKPDIILSFTIKPNIYGNIVARFLQIPVINNISGLGKLFINESFVTRIVKVLYRLSLRGSSCVFFQNQTDLSLFVKNKLVDNDVASLIPGSGVDVDYYNISRENNKGERFLFFGRLLTDKGVLEFLAAAKSIIKKYPNLEFLLAGEIIEGNTTSIPLSRLKEYTNGCPQIKYLGKIHDVKNLLTNVDVLVLPSYREGLSKALVEAASMELPIVTTDVPGCRDVVQHMYNGILCEAKSAISLEESILKMISLSESERLRFGMNGRAKVLSDFSIAIVNKVYIDRISDIYYMNRHSEIS